MIKVQFIDIKTIELGALLNVTQNGKGYCDFYFILRILCSVVLHTKSLVKEYIDH